jgi:Fe(3+) dicitrate transport protein
VTGFLLRYDNRFGTLGLTDETGTFITYRTNIGNSETKGLEIFIQGDWNLSKKSSLSISLRPHSWMENMFQVKSKRVMRIFLW